MTSEGDAFRHAAASLLEAPVRAEVILEETAAPRKLAPYATALAARIPRESDPDDDTASGQLIVLYDPEGQQVWPGTFRLVVYIHADMELEIAADPLLGPVGWSWLTDALDARSAAYLAPSGTVTRAISESFGDKSDDDRIVTFELRASWTPQVANATELGAHVGAFTDVLGAAAGLPPVGVRSLHGSGPRA